MLKSVSGTLCCRVETPPTSLRPKASPTGTSVVTRQPGSGARALLTDIDLAEEGPVRSGTRTHHLAVLPCSRHALLFAVTFSCPFVTTTAGLSDLRTSERSSASSSPLPAALRDAARWTEPGARPIPEKSWLIAHVRIRSCSTLNVRSSKSERSTATSNEHSASTRATSRSSQPARPHSDSSPSTAGAPAVVSRVTSASQPAGALTFVAFLLGHGARRRMRHSETL